MGIRIMIEKIKLLPRWKLNYNLGIISPECLIANMLTPHACPCSSGFIVGATKLYKVYFT